MNFKNYIMKYLFVFLLTGLMLSCGPNREEIKEEERIRMEVKEELEEEKRIEAKRADYTGDEKSIVVVNGKNVSTIKIGNLEIMTEDLGKRLLGDAMKACADLGDGWRLPTIDELNILYENKDEIGGFASNYYWSSTSHWSGVKSMQSFDDGYQHDDGMLNEGGGYVRAVRTF